jgi:hypothetical protein
MDEEQGKRAELLRLWREYGKAYNVFVPQEQPHPHAWDLELPKPDDRGTLDPQALKHWRYFEKTRDFLRQRYSDHGLLASAAPKFDCLVPKFQKPLEIPAEKRKRFKLPRKGDPTRWHAKAMSMRIALQEEAGVIFSGAGRFLHGDFLLPT